MRAGLIALLALALVGCDLDGDGFTTDDCDDDDPTVFPGAPESCNGVDDDCNTFVDDALVFSNYRVDLDGDLFGDPFSDLVSACAPVEGRVVDGTDCDDTDSGVHPGASEVCDGTDNDCDGGVDEDLPTSEYRTDADGDGWGDRLGEPLVSCAPIDGLVARGGDCDDEDPTRNPGAEEICNDVDDDCNGGVDDGLEFLTYYPDIDGDGFGDPSALPVLACMPPEDHVEDERTDCDDQDPNVRPDQTDPCLDCDATNDAGCL